MGNIDAEVVIGQIKVLYPPSKSRTKEDDKRLKRLLDNYRIPYEIYEGEIINKHKQEA